MRLETFRTVGWRYPVLNPFVIGIPLILLACIAVYGRMFSYGFTGVDILPLIASNRVASVADFGSLFTAPSLDVYQDRNIAAPPSFRPVGQLMFALDYWAWGLNAFGYHLTNFAIHIANSGLLVLLVRRLEVVRWRTVGLLAGLLFAVHPLQASILPSIETRYELLLGTFTILSIIWVLKYFEDQKRRYLGLSLLCGVLALGSKETAVLLLPMVAVVALYARVLSPKNLRPIGAVMGSWLAITAGYLLYRWWVLGEGLGGYEGNDIDHDFVWRLTLQEFLNPLLHFVVHLYDGPLHRLVIRIELAVVLFLVLIAALGFMRFALRRRDPLSRFMEHRIGSDWKPVTLLSSWLVILVAFYLAVSLRTGVFQSWYVYVPVAFFSIILSLVTVHIIRLLAVELSKPRISSLGFLAVGVAAVPIVILFSSYTWGLVRSPQLGAWSSASVIGQQYLTGIQKALSALPDGSTLFLFNLPHGVQCAHNLCQDQAYMFEDYSVDSWIKLTMPERQFNFIAVSTIWIDPKEGMPESQVFYDRASRLIRVENSSGSADLPWQTRSGEYLKTDLEPSRRSRSVEVHITDDRVLASGSHYIFDYFEPRKLMALTREGPVPAGEPHVIDPIDTSVK